MSSDEIQRNVFVTTSREAYQHFLSDDWAERIEKLARPAKKLSLLVFDLVLDWRAAAYAASMPLTIVEHQKAYHDGFINTGEVNTNLVQLAENIPALLAHELPDLALSSVDKKRLQAKLVDIGARFSEAHSRTKIDFPMEETWQSYLQDHVFQLMLWGTQKICFVSIYNTYENLIVHCVKAKLGINKCRTGSDKFQTQFETAFDASLWVKCWDNDELKIVREVRHSLSHAGGRITDQLKPLKHGFEIRDERIQVTPEKTKELLALLKGCAYSLVEKAVTMPAFA